MPVTDALRGRRAECAAVDRIAEAVRAGESRALVLHGEPGVGKTALLDYLAGRAEGCRVARVSGVQSEMELAFAGLHQLCGPLVDRLDRLPVPQRDVLRVVFGLSTGVAPDWFLVGLAVLGLLSEAADERPLVCVIDDEQWLDRASAQVLAFVAHRLVSESVGLVFATRVPGEELAGLPQLVVEGLAESDARALLESALRGPLDPRIRDQIVVEARGNPLALLELPRGLTPEQLAGGFGLPAARSLPGRIEESFGRQLDALPAQTGRLLKLAAADPSGDALLVWRAATALGISDGVAEPAVEAGLVEFDAQVRFRHPLVRSAAYRSASVRERRQLHRALADVTDPQADPDRRAWHRAQAASAPDENVAGELERSAHRAQSRGGLAAAAAFLERAALLTPELARRTERILAAAQAKADSGGLDAALELLVKAEAGPVSRRQAAEMEYLRGQVAFGQGRGDDCARLLLNAARLFEPVDADRSREIYLDALGRAAWISADARQAAAQAARAAPAGVDPKSPVDALLDAFALLLTEGYATAAPALIRARDLVLALEAGSGEATHCVLIAWQRASQLLANLGDSESWHALAARQLEAARDVGALYHVRAALGFLAVSHTASGELAAATQVVEEDRLLGEAIGTLPNMYAPAMLAAWKGQEAEASEAIETAVRLGTAWGLGSIVNGAVYASAVLYNGLGQYDAARGAAQRVFEDDPVGHGFIVVPELAEAASRTGDAGLLREVLYWLSERTSVTATGWLLGIHALVRALLSDGETAEPLYEESIEHLGRTRVRSRLARAHLLYGEWLRRQGRRADARGHLHTAHGMLDEMGMAAFADRAHRELVATGETVRKRAVLLAAHSRQALTAQEALVARLAQEGLSNPQIGARLFLSTRTVQYHLSKVFAKLGITSRGQLHQVLPDDPDTVRSR